MAKKVAPKADAGRAAMPAPPERIPPGKVLVVDGVTGEWLVVDPAREQQRRDGARLSVERTRRLFEDKWRKEEVAAKRRRGLPAANAARRTQRATANAALLREAKGMQRRGLSKSAIARHLKISRDRLDRILAEGP